MSLEDFSHTVVRVSAILPASLEVEALVFEDCLKSFAVN